MLPAQGCGKNARDGCCYCTVHWQLLAARQQVLGQHPERCLPGALPWVMQVPLQVHMVYYVTFMLPCALLTVYTPHTQEESWAPGIQRQTRTLPSEAVHSDGIAPEPFIVWPLNDSKQTNPSGALCTNFLGTNMIS